MDFFRLFFSSFNTDNKESRSRRKTKTENVNKRIRHSVYTVDDVINVGGWRWKRRRMSGCAYLTKTSERCLKNGRTNTHTEIDVVVDDDDYINNIHILTTEQTLEHTDAKFIFT